MHIIPSVIHIFLLENGFLPGNDGQNAIFSSCKNMPVFKKLCYFKNVYQCARIFWAVANLPQFIQGELSKKPVIALAVHKKSIFPSLFHIFRYAFLKLPLAFNKFADIA